MIVKMKPKKIPKYLIVFCLISQFFFGIDFGFGCVLRRNVYIVIAKYYTFALSLLFISILGYNLTVEYNQILLWISFIKYILHIFVLLKVKYKFYNFALDINDVNSLSVIENQLSKFLVVVYSTVTFLIKLVFLVNRCLFVGNCSGMESPLSFILVLIPSLGLDSIAIVQILIPFYMYSYMKQLKQFVRNTNGNNLKSLEKRYRIIADIYDKVWPLISYLTFLELLIGIPRLLGTVWLMLHYIKSKYDWYSYMTEYIFATHFFIQISFPAIVIEMINVHMEEIKSILNERLMTQVDPRFEASLLRMLRYLKARKLRRRVLRFIPVDLQQLIALCSVCTTYFIIIVQFTHLYD